MVQNKVGLEAEYLLRDGEGKVVTPGTYCFSTDDFPLLGEVRGKPGETRAKTVANFYEEWYSLLYQVKEKGLSVDLSGYTTITPEEYATLLRQMGTKEIAQCENIYEEIDLLTLSNQITKRGAVQTVVISTGLHIHFSSSDELEITTPRYNSHDFPLKITRKVTKPLTLYEKVGEHVSHYRLSRITKPVIVTFVSSLDEVVLPKYHVEAPKVVRRALKYRRPGFYERKPYGFEYRSLPFTEQVLTDLWEIVDFAYNLLEAL